VNVGEFPTRSHAHAWSSAPVYFLNRIILGLRPVKAGGEAFEISPWIEGLDWAEGAVMTMKGLVRVRWEKQAGKVEIDVQTPPGVEAALVENESLRGWTCVLRKS
jgi:hypothetical protein